MSKTSRGLLCILPGLVLSPGFPALAPVPTLTSGFAAASQANQAQTAPTLAVVNESGKSTSFTAEALAKLPRKTVTIKESSGAQTSYEGVSMADLLRAAKATLGKDLKGSLVANYVLVEAADKYRAVFSLVEIDPELTDNVVLVADRKDGKLIDDKEGPYRLVVPGDKRHMRWVRQVTRISVRSAEQKQAPQQRKYVGNARTQSDFLTK